MSRLRNLKRSTVLALVASLFFVGGWLDNRSTGEQPFSPVSRVLVVSSAGPITISRGDELVLAHRDSWLFSRPVVEWAEDDDEVVIRVQCPGRFPCRSAISLMVPIGSDLVVVAEGHSAHLESFDGDVTVYSSGEDAVVTLGAISGSGRVVTSGARVQGFGVQLDHLDIETRTARIDVTFDTPPTGVAVSAGADPVSLVLPEEDYQIAVVSPEGRYRAGIDNVPEAERTVLVESDGLVQISPMPQ